LLVNGNEASVVPWLGRWSGAGRIRLQKIHHGVFVFLYAVGNTNSGAGSGFHQPLMIKHDVDARNAFIFKIKRFMVSFVVFLLRMGL
jgi:hypothetical protein